ncbi:arylsulfatase [Tamlana sp. 62-3]|uniref:Arylsulfatase n=1 Tax=Neotamlana sargassicola TaxID=2883125 RepID=A0A9X1L469_9FLAO|nr:arylsulfatase [Tamlana sargassicola]MCB4807877.1 arylsulfatase [Tamlana sargassicola]
MKISITFFLLFSVFTSCANKNKDSHAIKENLNKPNIIIINLDDLGYGDLSCYGATEIKTPNIDKLANNGLLFTNGYATSATCSPSRFSLLTGVYPWRNKRAKILAGDAPLLIDTAQQTLPKLLNKAGYNTAIIGKWHLGLGSGHVNWNNTITPGPNQVGFNESYILAATQDRVPTVYIHNGNVVNLDKTDPIQVNYKKNFLGEPTALSNPELVTMKWHHGHNNSIVNGIPRIGFMKGGENAKWSDIDMADHFLGKAKDFIKSNKNTDFFLYYAMQQPHVPRTPHPRFVGKSGMGPRGDAILEADWCVGELLKTLKNLDVLNNTLIVFTSDNGPVLNDGYFDEAEEKLGKHDPKGGLRGGKYSLFEAGTRVPFITYWPGVIKSGVSQALVCQIDLLASLGCLVGEEVNATDSKNILKAFTGKSNQGRDHLIIEAKSRTALRSGDWVMIPAYKGNPINSKVNIETGILPKYQLYNLKTDRAQKHNLASENPEKLNAMIKIFKNLKS